MQTFLQHIRTYIVRGILAIAPILLCTVAVAMLYKFINKFLGQFFNVHQYPGLPVLILFLFLFVTGLIVSNVIGQQVLRLIERVSARIPLVNHIYGVSKEMSDVITSKPGGNVFEKAVLVNYPNANQWTVALVTGRVKDRNTGEDWLKVYIPMGHPFVGFVYVVKEQQTRDPGWSVEDALKTIISLGIITPETV